MEIICIKKAELKKINYNSLEHWLENPNHVYIGRNMTFYVSGATKSKWSNPFSVKKYGRNGCLNKYREYIQNNAELMAQLPELEGKILGCWCKPEKCHGDILVELVSNL